MFDVPRGASKIIMAVLLILMLTIPINGYDPAKEDLETNPEDTGEEGPVDETIPISRAGDLGLGSEFTRSAPWKEWERFHYHRGGESGAASYNASSNKIYLYGGGSESYRQGRYSYSAYDDMFAYDLDTDRWIAIERDTSPGARFRMSYATDEENGIMYVYGGYQGTSSGIMVNDLWAFHMGTETWERVVSSGPLPSQQRRVQAPMVFDPDYGTEGALYIHMGRDDNRDNISRFYRIDMSDPGGTPETIPDGQSDGMETRWGHDMVLDRANDRIYIFGGYHRENAWNEEALREMWYFDMGAANPSWFQITLPVEMPTLIGAKMFLNENGTINVWGGRRSENSDNENETLWVYNPQMESWSWKHYPDTSSARPDGRGYYSRYYSSEDDLFVVFAGMTWGGWSSGNQRDLNYLNTRFTLEWTQFPNDDSSGTNDNGILCHNKDLNRIYYVGPTSSYYNGTEYLYYWDLNTRDWVGPFYSSETNNPRSRSNAGLCYLEETNEVYLYGGGYTQGQYPNREYHTLSDLWKLDLDTYQWTEVYPQSFPGMRQGMELLYNPDNGLIYFYGGYEYLDPSDTSTMKIYDEFWTYNPNTGQFLEITSTGSYPEGRYGSSLCYVPDEQVIYLFGGEYLEIGSQNSKEEHDIWKFYLGNKTWKEMDAGYKPSSRKYAEMVYDPLTRELYLTGGSSNDDFQRYRILENRWYFDWYFVPNPGMLDSHSMVFIQETRDIWLFGGGAKAGMWRLGIPPRLGIQDIKFMNPEEASDLAYAMLKPYDFQVKIETVNGPEDLDEMKIRMRHGNGYFTLVYDRDADVAGEDPWTETDNGDYAELSSEPTVIEEGEMITITIPLLFHWNWSHRSSYLDRWVEISCTGHDVEPDSLVRTNFLRVRNKLEMEGKLIANAAIQGHITNSSWVRSSEEIIFHGPVVEYRGTDRNPPVDTYTVSIWNEEGVKLDSSSSGPGEEINMSVVSPNTTETEYEYVINITGVPEATDTTDLTFTLKVDGDTPRAPGQVVIHADDFDDSRTRYDDEQEVFVTWQSAQEFSSGVKTYYYSFQDNGGTRNGIAVKNLSTTIQLPQVGENTVFIWAEDLVGNIGPASNGTILIDQESVEFEILSPDLNKTIPYSEIDMRIRITDSGGSLMDSQQVQYRYTYLGLNHESMWLSDNAWKHITKIWDLDRSDNFTFNMTVKGLSNSVDNYIQFRAKDGASSTYFTSEIFNIKVDYSLAYPNVTLIGPADKSAFENAENVLLEWEVNFFDPEDVEYYLYMSDDKQKVSEKDESTLWRTLTVTEYHPTGLVFGSYYWTVIPVAKGEYIGECLSGIYSFDITNEENYAFTVSTENERMKLRQGMFDIPLEFTIINQANTNGYFTPTVKGLLGMNISWDVLPAAGYKVDVNSEYIATAYLDIPENIDTGNYTLEIIFTNQYGINKSVSIDIQVTPMEEEGNGGGDDGFLSLTTIIIIAVLALVLILIVVSILYFFVFKPSGEEDGKTGKALEEELEDMEKEYGIQSGGIAMAPQPAQSRTKASPSTAQSQTKPEEQGDVQAVPPEEEEPFLLAEEGSEDDWMNLVARETKTLESQSEIEEDKAAKSDGSTKTLAEILAEMDSGEDD